jgi:hypothetical protein
VEAVEKLKRATELLPADPRAWNKLREFLLLWLKVDTVPDLAKNAQKYPDFDARVALDLRTSLDLFLDDVGNF